MNKAKQNTIERKQIRNVTFKLTNGKKEKQEMFFTSPDELEKKYLNDSSRFPEADAPVSNVKVGIHTVCVGTFGELLRYLGIKIRKD